MRGLLLGGKVRKLLGYAFLLDLHSYLIMYI